MRCCLTWDWQRACPMAKALIMAGRVWQQGQRIEKAGQMLPGRQ